MRGPIDQVRPERGLFARDIAVELVEAAARRPPVERTADVDLERRHLVALAEVARAVAPAAEHLADRATLAADGRCRREAVAGRRRGLLALVLVAAGQQRHPSRRAERVDVEVWVRQAVLGQPVERGRADRPAEPRDRHTTTDRSARSRRSVHPRAAAARIAAVASPCASLVLSSAYRRALGSAGLRLSSPRSVPVSARTGPFWIAWVAHRAILA